MANSLVPFMTEDEYLARERASGSLSEYFSGSIYEVSGAAEKHAIERAIRIGLTLRPDPICLTGDYATHSSDFHPKPYPAVLRLLSDAAPVYATFRNHDGGLWARDANSFAGCSAIGTYSRSLESR